MNRAAACVAAAVLVFVCTSGPSPRHEPYGPIARDSPFVQERLRAPTPTDFAANTALVVALRAAGHADEALRLTHAWERGLAKRLLGEPHAASASVAAAIEAELHAEPIEKLRARVLERVSLQPLPPLDASSVSRQRTRMMLSNGLTLPVTQLTFHAEGWDSPFHCRPEAPTAGDRARIAAAMEALRAAEALPDGNKWPPPRHRASAEARSRLQQAIDHREAVPVAPGASAAVACNEAREPARSLLAGGGTWTASIVHTAPYMVSRSMARGPFEMDPYELQQRALDGASCESLMVCEEDARRAREELRKRLPQLVFASSAIIGGLLLWGVTRPLARRAAPPGNALARIATVGTAVILALQLALANYLLNPRMISAIPWVIGLPILLAAAQLGTAGVLGATLALRREQVTRLRVFLLAFTLLVVALPAFVLLRCGYSPYTLTLSCR